MYNNFLKNLKAADKKLNPFITEFNLNNVLNEVVQEFKFTNKSGDELNLFRYRSSKSTEADLYIRYVPGLSTEKSIIKTEISQSLHSNSNTPYYHVATLLVDNKTISDENLFSKPGYSNIYISANPLGNLSKNISISYDAFSFFKSILEQVVTTLETKVEPYKYVVTYTKPYDVTDEVYFQNEKLLSTEYGEHVLDNLSDIVIESYIYYMTKIKESPKLLGLNRFTEVTFDSKTVKSEYTHLVDTYIRSSEFMSIFKQFIYKLNALSTNDNLESNLKNIVSIIEADPELNNYIDDIIDCFVADKQINYNYEKLSSDGKRVTAKDYTKKYIQRFFGLFEEYVIDILSMSFKGDFIISPSTKDLSDLQSEKISKNDSETQPENASETQSNVIQKPLLQGSVYEIKGEGPAEIYGITWNVGDYLFVIDNVAPGESAEGKIKKINKEMGSKIKNIIQKDIIQANSIYEHFVKRMAVTIGELMNDEENMKLELLRQKLKNEGYIDSEIEEILNSDPFENVDNPQIKQQEEAIKQVKQDMQEQTVTDQKYVEDNNEIAQKLVNNHEFVLEGFKDGVYNEDIKQEFKDLVQRAGYIFDDDTADGKPQIKDESGKLVDEDECKSLLEDFAYEQGLINEDREPEKITVDLSEYMNIKPKDEDKPNFNIKADPNFILDKTKDDNTYNYFVSQAKIDKKYLEQLLTYIQTQYKSGLDDEVIIESIGKRIYNLPIEDNDLLKSLLLACAYPADNLGAWLEHISSLVSLDIEILNIFIEERHDRATAIKRLKALFNIRKSLENYFLKANLLSIDKNILEKINFVNKHPVLTNVKLFLSYILNRYGYTIELNETNSELQSIYHENNKKIGRSKIKLLLQEFNRRYNKSLTYDQLFNTKINWTNEQLSRPLMEPTKVEYPKDNMTSEQEINKVFDEAHNEYLYSLNNQGINNLLNKLNFIENKINEINWGE